MTQINPKELRQAFGSFLTGVTVVTTTDTQGNRFGFTANSFTSVSIDPPILLVCPGKFLSSFDAFATCTHFAVNILAEGQEHVANTFAGYKGDRFAQVDWTPDAQGVPLIAGAVTQFSCTTHDIIPAGDHIILMGRVDSYNRNNQRGLGYSSGRFFSLGMERDAATPQGAAIAGAIIERDGQIFLQKTAQGWTLPHVDIPANQSARQALANHFGQAVTLGKAFSIFTENSTKTRFTYIQGAADAASDLGTFVPIDALTTLPMVSATQSVMLNRYALERGTGHFGLYVGDETSGDIHIYDEGN